MSLSVVDDEAVRDELDEAEWGGLSNWIEMALCPFCGSVINEASRFFNLRIVSSGSNGGDSDIV